MTRTRYRWFIVFLLFAITGVNYIDRAAISYAIPLIQRDLGLSPGDTGTFWGRSAWVMPSPPFSEASPSTVTAHASCSRSLPSCGACRSA